MTTTESMLHILTSLGNSILNSFWQMGLLWLLITILLKFKNDISPKLLASFSFSALLTGFLSFIATFFLSVSYKPGSFDLLQGINQPIYLKNIRYITACIYLILLIIPLSRFFIAYYTTYFLKRKGLHKVPGRYKLFALDIAAYLQIKKPVKIWLSDRVKTPLTLGFLKPVILLPITAITQLTPLQIEAVILHELAHIKKYDYLRNLVVQLIMTLFYFNPFAKALLNIHQTEREKIADNSVLQFEYQNHMYAETLLQLAKQQVAHQHQLAVQAISHTAQLHHRVQWIMGLQKRPLPQYKNIISSVILITFFTGNFFIANTPALTAVTKSETAKSIALKPIIHYTLQQNSNSKYEVREIPAIISKAENQQNTVYLKQYENPKTGNIEIIKPTTDETPADRVIFATDIQPVIPVLTPKQELNINESIEAAKKVYAEAYWNKIDATLAETVTIEQKDILKKAFKLMMEKADWTKEADKLRILYNEIDWDKTKANFNMAMAQIKLDSIQQHLTKILEIQETLKKEMNTHQFHQLDMQIKRNERIVFITDSIRKNKIIEL
ncbi:MAG: M56 family metallopeptidase [Niabella sp.]